MAHLLRVRPDAATMTWAIFVDHRPVTKFNRDFEILLSLTPGEHRLVVHANGRGATVKVSIDNAELLSPDTDWPLVLKVPSTSSGDHVIAEFSV